MIYLPNGNIVGGDKTSLKIWDYRKGECLKSIESHSNYISDLIYHKN